MSFESRVCIFINTSHETTTFLASLGSLITLAIAYTWAHLLYRSTFRRAGAFFILAKMAGLGRVVVHHCLLAVLRETPVLRFGKRVSLQ